MKRHEDIVSILFYQLKFFGEPTVVEIEALREFAPKAQEVTQMSLGKCIGIPKVFNLLQTHHCIIFLYRLAKLLFEDGASSSLCEKLYLLNRMVNGVDLFYKIDMPQHFLVGHGLGTVFSNAVYGDYLVIFQNVTVGVQDGVYPTIGEQVVVYPNSVIAGRTLIGNNCIIGAGTRLINKTIPDNSVVYENGSKLIVKPNERSEIIKYFKI